MVSPTVRGRGGTGTGPRTRAVTAAARAAAKRSERAHAPTPTTPEPKPTATPRPQKPRESRKPKESKQTTAKLQRTTAKLPPTHSATLSAVLAGLVAVGLVAVTLLGLQYRDTAQSRQARTDALAAAEKAAPVILSYDYRHLDRDFATASSHLTGSFRAKYRKTTSKVVMPTAKKYRGVVKATVAKPRSGKAPAASVVSASPNRVVVLLFMNQVTKSTQISGPRLDLNRVRMTLVPSSDKWKVSAVDAL
jgi:Mce-associated membrane protein